MSGRGQGRRAALPPPGFRPQPRLRDEPDSLVVRVVAEDHGGGGKDFDFTNLPVSPALRTALAQAFAQRTRPGGGLRALSSADLAFRRLARFAGYLGDLAHPPVTAGDLTPAHVEGWRLQRSHLVSLSIELIDLKATLRRVRGISAAFAAKLTEHGQRPQTTRSTSYSRAEFDRILNAARDDIRRAAKRIRANREELAGWRAGQIHREHDEPRWQRGHLLDVVDQHGDVPRTGNRPVKWVARLGRVTEHVTALHLSVVEAAAFAVLLVGVTGQNRGTILNAPAAYHRPDGYAGGIPTAIVELDKPRRGPRRHMDVALVGLPDWVAVPRERPDHDLDLRTAFGVYILLHELAAAARRIVGTDRLLVWWACGGGKGVGRGLRTSLDSDRVADWASGHDLMADPTPNHDEQDQSRRLRVTLPLLRLTYAELHQKPVAHTERTLVNEYLVRNRGNITDYQRVVADTLTEEVTKAKTRSALRILTPQEVEQARTDPRTIAARHGLDTATLTRMIAGELDTVMATCTDYRASPHAPAGQPCRASFMLCLSCPCARALPHHLPLQVAVHDALLARQAQTTPLRWAQRFGLPHAQLADLLDRAGPTAVSDARAHITDAQRDLVARFLRRELDVI